ncbi:two-component system response regulator [Aliidiomarina minuta]|uniref:Two-component system response regulator n=1 Tax=Aliidiomarina minuta TaxID=880057 RepID=A0A432W7V8_9GAMM|nr:response regulator [Aliidiomarina minuta]RUO26109.1 two-component system response regulator [Aliidiomarina minuta]
MHTVLIADDDNISLEVLKAMLSSYPLTIITAEDGEQAIQLATQEDPDLIILDYDMPNLTGADACRQLRQLSQFEDLPIIALTGHQSVSELNACRTAGMDATLHKPVSPDALDSLLREHLSL